MRPRGGDFGWCKLDRMARSGSPRETAEKIILAAFKVLLPGMAIRVEGMKDIADIVYGGQDKKRLHQSLLHRLEESVDLLAERLGQFEAIEIPNLQRGEKDQVIEGACNAMASVNLSTARLIKDQLDPEKLVREVRPIARQYWRDRDVSEAATEYGEHYLELACRYVTALVRELPEFSDELLLQNYTTTEKIYELLQRGIATVIQPAYSKGVPSEVATFEAAYLTDIVQSYKDMELFGLTGLPPELCRQPIDIAYIALQSLILSGNANTKSTSIGHPDQQASAQPEITPAIQRVHAAFEVALRAGMVEDGRGARVHNPDRAARVLLTGAAGSGKTTVAHWLAIRSAEHRFPELLRYWNDCFPFVVPLRHLFRGSKRFSPRERDLVWSSGQREGQLPEGWLESKLAGHALVILDGLDELSELHKSDLRLWLSRLIRDYPLANLIVTSRPESLDYEWFRQQDFIHLELQPMDPNDVRLCVESWFNAVVATDVRRETSYRKTQKRLIADLDQSTAVRELAETPLLCAMLCAFYAYNLSAVAPQTRGELYERVINSLVHTRDVARSSDRISAGSIPPRAKIDLLQALARYMVEQTQPRFAVPVLRMSSATSRRLRTRSQRKI